MKYGQIAMREFADEYLESFDRLLAAGTTREAFSARIKMRRLVLAEGFGSSPRGALNSSTYNKALK